MASLQRAITAPPSPYLRMTPPDSPPRELSLRNTDKDDLKQVLVDAIKQALFETSAAATFGNPQPPNASQLTQLLMEVIQTNPPFEATTESSKPRFAGANENQDQPPLDAEVRVPPNTPLPGSSEPVLENRSESIAGSVTGPTIPDQIKSDTEDGKGTSSAKSRASVLGFKKVMEVWDKETSKYKIVESIETNEIIDDLDQYLFVVCEHINKDSKEVTSYIDVKSEPLREILREVLWGVRAVSLMEDKPSIKEDILFHFHPELCEYVEKLRCRAGDDAATQLAHLIPLVDRIKHTYKGTMERFTSLLQHGEITYDLLWALFKPGCPVYTKCFGTEKPRCVIFDAGKETTVGGITFFKLECRYMDYDGKVFGEAELSSGIVKFQGSKLISTLPAFPLHHHPAHARVRSDLTRCGKKFCDLMGTHIRQCNGTGFIMQKGEIIRTNINSCVAVDAAFFCEMRPNYSRPNLEDTWKKTAGVSVLRFGDFYEAEETEKAKGKDRDQLTEDDLLICCPTVRCFSFEDKCFLECAVADLTDAKWFPETFDSLKIPEDTRQILHSLATTRLGLIPTVLFDDVIAGKGRGLNVLLHGPPGVGKTFTVEATSEKFNLPLYSISAGDLIVRHGDPQGLDCSLDEIFKIAKHFKAVLLLDEADVFMERRTSYLDSHNQLLTIFLRKLEYYEGILFLTTNRVSDFDEAILSRIHLKIKYDNLTKEARREIWKCFLSKARTHQGASNVDERDLERLASMKLNGRDIKNLTSVAHALATVDESQMTFQHLETAARSNDKFIEELSNHGRMEGLYT